MPYKDPKKRRRYDKQPEQREKNAERQARFRERQEALHPLKVILRMARQKGCTVEELNIAPGLKARVIEHQALLEDILNTEEAATKAANRAFMAESR